MANSGGGVIVVGVNQETDGSLEPKGLATFTDETEIRARIHKYIPDGLHDAVVISNFRFGDQDTEERIAGKQFQVLFVADDPRHLPFVALGDGKDIRNGAVYTRRGTATVEASHEEFQRIINRRLATGYSTRAEIDLAQHLEELRVLFRQIPRAHTLSALSSITDGFANIFQTTSVPNLDYPDEDFDTFVLRMIAKKKYRIELALDVHGLPDDAG